MDDKENIVVIMKILGQQTDAVLLDSGRSNPGRPWQIVYYVGKQGSCGQSKEKKKKNGCCNLSTWLGERWDTVQLNTKVKSYRKKSKFAYKRWISIPIPQPISGKELA